MNQHQSFSTSIDNLVQLPALYTNGHHPSAFRPYAGPTQQNFTTAADSAMIKPNPKPLLSQNLFNREPLSVSMGNLNSFAGNGALDQERLVATLSSEEDVITELSKCHLEAQMLLAQRESNLKLCLKAHQVDPVRAFQIASSTQDMTLMADLLRYTLVKP